jgi:hypothetical protein
MHILQFHNIEPCREMQTSRELLCGEFFNKFAADIEDIY